jgi:signal transduction histidine kinase
MDPKDNIQTVNWQFDISTFRLLGRELITNRITAVFELVKNCYDANAENVWVEFHNVGAKSEHSRIIIRDDGIGMSEDEIKNSWMVVGTSSKRRKLVSDPPYNRIYIGDKGIGRFAVGKLGSRLMIRTKKTDQTVRNILEIDWNEYENISSRQLNLFDKNETKYFTDIPNKFWTEASEKNDKGTELIISFVREIWTKPDIDRLYKELSKLISPLNNLSYPFNIAIRSNEHESYEQKSVESIAVEEFASEYFSLEYDLNSQTQEIIKHDKGRLIRVSREKPSFGFIKFRLYYFDQYAKGKFKKTYKGTPFEDFIDGIKVYRNGLITTPFAEHEAHQDKKRDILGIDKRRYSGFFEKVSSKDLLGIVEITKDLNPKIIDATARQDFVINKEYTAFKNFIIEQIYELEKYLKYRKNIEQGKTSQELKTAADEIGAFTERIKEIEKKHPTVKKDLAPLTKDARKIKISVERGIKEFKRKENLYLSMLSLQEFAGMLAHAVKTKIGQIRDTAKFLSERFPDEKYIDQFKVMAKKIYHHMIAMNQAVEYALSFSKADTEPYETDMKQVIENVFEQNSFRFSQEKIRPIIEIKESLILVIAKKIFEDILQQLIDNSVKALKNTENKIIKCSAVADADKLIIYFSDNGAGIKDGDKEKIFEIYFTTTHEEGGSGLGLWIADTRIKQLNGEILVAENEFKPSGTTFQMTLPFKKR